MKIHHDRREELVVRAHELPLTLRCSLPGCPSLDRNGSVLCTIVALEASVTLRRRCAACGATYSLTVQRSARDEPSLLSRREVASLLRVSPSTIDRLRRQGLLEGIKIGRGRNATVRFARQELSALLASPHERPKSA